MVAHKFDQLGIVIHCATSILMTGDLKLIPVGHLDQPTC